MNQSSFLSCYRARQRVWHHAAYLRMAKVLLLQHMLSRGQIDLAGKRIFDYGFGAGTFYRYCPRSAQLFGVELDPVCIAEVRAMLARRGYAQVCLEKLTLESWSEHPLWRRCYDLIICSHVLEHLPEPEVFLGKIRICLGDEGRFLGLVPINERKRDPHHLRGVTRSLVESWLPGADLTCVDWVEADPWLYWLQPLFAYSTGYRHRAAQIASLGLGMIATVCGHRWWSRLARPVGRLTGSRPTQAAFVLQPQPEP